MGSAQVHAVPNPQTPDALHPPAAWRANAAQIARRQERRAHSSLGGLLLRAYRFKRARSLVYRLSQRLEGGPIFSQTLRLILQFYHGVTVGPYSYGDILKPGVLTPGCEVGAYCSIGSGLIVRRRDHPTDRLTQSPLFYNRKLGLVRRDTIAEDRDNPLSVGHDVWIGDRVTILSGCRQIGNGAVLAAGSVVTKDVAPYTIVGGVPAKALRLRYPQATAMRLDKTRWWRLKLPDLLAFAPQLLIAAEQIDQDVLDAIQRRTDEVVLSQ